MIRHLTLDEVLGLHRLAPEQSGGMAGVRDIWKKAMEGRNMGESMVINEWIDEGRLRASRANLLRVIRARFGAPIPKDVSITVENQASLAELDRWIDLAATADSLDAFRAALSQ